MGQTGDIAGKASAPGRSAAAAGTPSPTSTGRRVWGSRSMPRRVITRPETDARDLQSVVPERLLFHLAGYTGYVNLIHLKPSLTVKPIANLALMVASGLQWRKRRRTPSTSSRTCPSRAPRGRRGPGPGVLAVPSRLDDHAATSRPPSKPFASRSECNPPRRRPMTHLFSMSSSNMDSDGRTAESAWTPLSHPVFRALWIASLVSNVGTLDAERQRGLGG